MTDSDTRWLAIALVYGPPEEHWRSKKFTQGAMSISPTLVPLKFRMVCEDHFHPGELARVGLRRLAYDYAEWYYLNENHTQQSSGNDGLLPSERAGLRE